MERRPISWKTTHQTQQSKIVPEDNKIESVMTWTSAKANKNYETVTLTITL